MKSISDLNNRWWYRLLKVLYGGVFLLIAIVTALIVFNANKTYLAPDLNITCDFGNKAHFNAFHDRGISIADFDNNKQVPPSLNTQILKACDITQDEIVTAAANSKATALKQYNDNDCANQPTAGLRVNLIQKYLCQNINAPYQTSNMYSITTRPVPIPTYWKAALYAILDLFVILIIFEVIRRVFYYIAIGKVKPIK